MNDKSRIIIDDREAEYCRVNNSLKPAQYSALQACTTIPGRFLFALKTSAWSFNGKIGK